MSLTDTSRRDFIKVSAAAGGGLLLGVTWLTSCKQDTQLESPLPMPASWKEMSAYVKIGDTGRVTIFSPNPEIGQNVKTSMPMILAEELDVDWKDVIVQQAGLDTDNYTRQVAGGSQSIRQGWLPLRKAGAAVRAMLLMAAAEVWETQTTDLTTALGKVYHPDGRVLGYGQLASIAAAYDPPEDPPLKDLADFKIIGTGKENVDLHAIVTGAPLYGIDTYREGMLYAVIKRPPAHGKSLKSYDDSAARTVKGIVDVVQMQDKIAVLATSTWPAIKASKLLSATYTDDDPLENSEQHSKMLQEMISKPSASPRRDDGDIESAMAQADEILERSYEAPFLPHNPLEPMNFYADVTDEKVELHGPIQTPEWQLNRIAEALSRPKEDISIGMTRMGGGFGRRLYGNFVMEAALLSDQVRKPIQLLWTREDDMTEGPFRPASAYRIRAAIKDNSLSGYHITGAGYGMRNACRERFWPTGCIENYRVESHNLDSNIPTGAWRAPVTNFLAFAEQTFFDELAEKMKLDAVQLRLDLLEKFDVSLQEEVDYDPEPMRRVIEVARDRSSWNERGNRHLGFSCYFSHNSYVAEVAEAIIKDDIPQITKVWCVVDCGIVINPKGAINQVEGGIIDGIGHAMYGDLRFTDGAADVRNFDSFRLIRMSEIPEIDVHFIPSDKDPTGLGEPTLPPAGAAVANALYSATGTRIYNQPYVKKVVG